MHEHEQHVEAAHGHQAAPPEVRRQAEEWWAARREFRPGVAWEVPFPPRAGETVRVLWQQADSTADVPELWKAALFAPRAATAWIEVHSHEGAVGALISLYEHVV